MARLLACAEADVVGHDDVRRYGQACRLLGAEEAGDQRVGHQLTATAWISGGAEGVGVLAQRPQHRDALSHRQLGRQPGHHVRRRAERDPAFGLRGPPSGHP